jgi:uncharacterized membrane protein
MGLQAPHSSGSLLVLHTCTHTGVLFYFILTASSTAKKKKKKKKKKKIQQQHVAFRSVFNKWGHFFDSKTRDWLTRCGSG